MMNRVWVALVVLACAGYSGGDDVRAAEGGTAVPYQVSAGKAATDQEGASQGREAEDVTARIGQEPAGEGKGAGKGEGKASDAKASDSKPGQAGAGHGKRASGQAGEAGALVDVNKASAEQLEALPGIGASMASRIVEYRQKHGPFKRLDDLLNVRGIGEKNFLKLKPLITVGSGKGDQPGTSQP